MRKVYRIIGESNTRPENLPAGFQVMESEEPFSADIDSHIGGARISLRQAHGINGAEVVVRLLDHNEEPLEQMFITDDSMRELRDALNDYLGEPEPAGVDRVFKDDQGDVWVETSSGRFTIDWNYGNGEPDLSHAYSDFSLQQLERYAPLTRLV